MARPPLRGRLEPGSGAPAEGERLKPLVELPAVTVEQILSGALPEPVSFEQAHDEWVVVLEGGARMLVDGDELELGPGEWLLLPAGCPHTVLETQPGTSWLAVHLSGV
ncbi:MAG TPA: cupin domain-containing protein [Gaiellaceae bacterium]|nr:cupin domain-containing protein [Gaiellaceae bacterium]